MRVTKYMLSCAVLSAFVSTASAASSAAAQPEKPKSSEVKAAAAHKASREARASLNWKEHLPKEKPITAELPPLLSAEQVLFLSDDDLSYHNQGGSPAAKVDYIFSN